MLCDGADVRLVAQDSMSSRASQDADASQKVQSNRDATSSSSFMDLLRKPHPTSSGLPDPMLMHQSRPRGDVTTAMASRFTERLLSQAERTVTCDNRELRSTPQIAERFRAAPSDVPEVGIKRFKKFARKVQLGLAMMKKKHVLALDKNFRILDRDAPFGQSKGHWAVRNVVTKDERHVNDDVEAVKSLKTGDAYHHFLDAKMYYQLGILAAIYIFCFVVFAALYLAIDEPCGLELGNSFTKAYLLSVEAMMTIGFGVPDPYLKGCWQGTIVLTTHCLLHLLITGSLIGVIFSKMSRPQSRACTILFSEKAVLRCVDGVYYFMLRIADLRISHSLIEAHVRCYCLVQHHVRGFEMVPMRLENPDDELGSLLCLSIPSVLTHRIDAWSPLAPSSSTVLPSRSMRRALRPAFSGSPGSSGSINASDTPFANLPRDAQRQIEALKDGSWPGTLQRQTDCETGSRDSCVCPTCGSSFQTAVMLQLHCRYNARMDVASGIPSEVCHRDLSEEELQLLVHEDPTADAIREHLSTSYVEVVVLVEGIEPTTSATLQSRHSYVLGPEMSDAAWDMDFADCIRVPTDSSKGLVFDAGRFHKLLPPFLGEAGILRRSQDPSHLEEV